MKGIGTRGHVLERRAGRLASGRRSGPGRAQGGVIALLVSVGAYGGAITPRRATSLAYDGTAMALGDDHNRDLISR